MPAIMVSRITVRDPQKLQTYMMKTKEIASSYGAELVYQTKVARTLNGASDHEMLVVAQFPSSEDLDAWYDSPEYQAIAPLREEGAEMHMTSYAV